MMKTKTKEGMRAIAKHGSRMNVCITYCSYSTRMRLYLVKLLPLPDGRHDITIVDTDLGILLFVTQDIIIESAEQKLGMLGRHDNSSKNSCFGNSGKYAREVQHELGR
jgi:hypothetical protein